MSSSALTIRRLATTTLCLLGIANAVFGEPLYYTTGSGTTSLDTLGKVELNGTGQATLASDAANFAQPNAVAVDTVNQKIYVGDGAGGLKILRYNLDGTGRTQIATTVAAVGGIALDVPNQKIYYTTGSGTTSLDTLGVVNFDGTGQTTLASDAANFAQPTGIALDSINQKLYVGDGAGGLKILRYNLDGTGRTQIATTVAAVGGLVLDVPNQKIYYTTGSGTTSLDTLGVVNFDGTGQATLASDAANFAQPTGIALDSVNQKLYVGDGAGGLKILRYDLNGSNRTQIATTVAAVTSLFYANIVPPPTVSSVSSSTGNGAYNAGDLISIQINFSATVTVTGTPQLTLETGSTDRAATYASGSGGSTLTFNYTVQAGDTASDLDYVSTSALALNGGTIKDAYGSSATLTLPSPGASGSLGANKALVIDTTAPSISLGSPSASLTRGGPVSYTVTYSDTNFSSSTLSASNVTVNSTGTASAASIGVSGSGSTRTVTLSGITGDGTLGISVAAGTASDTAGNTAAAAGPSTTFTVDNTAPTISIGAPSASITAGGPVTYTVTYSGQTSIALVAGNITLNSTGTANASVGVSGSGSTRTVTLSSVTGDGTIGISIAAGTASDTAGNTAAAAGPSATFAVDNTAPVITSLTTAGGTYNSSFSYAITASGSPSSYGASGLPSGLSVNSSSGDISGTPTQTGSFPVTISATDGAGNVGSATLDLTIAKATATVTLGGLNQVYNGSTRAATATTTPGSLTVNLTYDGSETAPTSAGSYAVVGTISDTNYQGSASGTLSVAKVVLTVTADAKTRPYGFANPTLTATITGFVGGDTEASAVSGAAGLSTAAATGSAPGAYTISTSIGTLAAANYSFGLADGVLTVRLQEFADWQEENFTPSELLNESISGPAADPDVDGVDNLDEYAFGTDPNDNLSGPDPLVYVGTFAGGGALSETGQPITRSETIPVNSTRVLFVRRTPALTSDITYSVEFSANGSTWVASSATPTVLATDGLYQVASVPYITFVGGKKTRYFRVVATLAE